MNLSGTTTPQRSANRLRQLRAGESAVVAALVDDARDAKRLADLGFVHGAKVEMLRTGVPCIVRIGGTFVGLGRRLQEAILLEETGFQE